MLKKLEAILGAMGCAAEEFKASIGPLRGKPPVEEAIALFKANPLRWFRDARGPYRWCQDLTNGRVWHTEDIGIYVGERPIGYVERFSITKETRTARIGHIAVAKGLEGNGLGYVIAHALRLGLVANYQVTTIVFAEDHTDYEEAGYPEFFTRLGATEVVEQVGWRPVWHWK